MERIAGIFWFSDFLRRISSWYTAGNWSGIYLVIFGILRQNFWAIHMIGIFNHRKTLPHLTPHAKIKIFYWSNISFIQSGLDVLLDFLYLDQYFWVLVLPPWMHKNSSALFLCFRKGMNSSLLLATSLGEG